MKALRVVPFLLLLLLAFACKPQVPGEYIQPDEFEDILYDFHLADGMADGDGENGDAAYDVTLYRQAVLHKYGVTQAEFDSSLVYYMRHADRLHKIYESLAERFEDEAMALGASANDIRRYGDMTSARDTSNLWRGVHAAMLMPYAPYNVMTFEIAADSTYRPGDKIIFSFNTDFVYKDGPKEGVALLAIQFKNDSVASSTVRMSSNSNYSVTVGDYSRKGIKAIRGFIYLGERRARRDDANREDLRLMFIDNIRMVRMRDNRAQSQTETASQPVNVRRDTIAKDAVKKPAGEAVKAPAGTNAVKPLEHRMLPAGRVAAPIKMSEVKPVPLQKRVKDK